MNKDDYTNPFQVTPETLEMLKNVKVGDTVTRMMAGVLPMPMKVTEVTDTLITCGATDAAIAGWTFSRKNGAEIDEDLGWNEQQTGSFLVYVESGTKAKGS